MNKRFSRYGKVLPPIVWKWVQWSSMTAGNGDLVVHHFPQCNLMCVWFN